MTATAAAHTVLVQLSDPHIHEPGRLAYGRVDTARQLEQAVASVLRLHQRPDAVVVTGDLTDFGRVAEYEHLAALLAPLDMPLYLMPGNHDDRAQLRRCFPNHAYLHQPAPEGCVQYSVAVGAVRLLALDTVVHGHSHGMLEGQRLAWLAAQLETHARKPVVVAMHHPPFATLIGHMDAIGLLEGADALEQLVRRHRNVERVVCGHLHRAIEVRFGGSIACTAPATCHQVTLDLQADAPSSWTAEPPGFRIHAWDGRRMVSHTVPTGRFDGPHPFHDAGGLID